MDSRDGDDVTAPPGRSVAKIIGWRFLDNLWDVDRYVTPHGDVRSVMLGADPPYTADDLLAWLGQQGYVWSIQRWSDHDIAVVAVHHRTEHYLGPHVAPTVLAALEAAVRAAAVMP